MVSRAHLQAASLFVAAALAVPVLLAQGVTVGRLAGNVHGFRPASGITLIDLAHPANASGNLTTATVRWFTQGTPVCSGAFKIKILRRPGVVPVDPDFTVVAERGPFDSSAGYVTVPLSPPVAVQPNDLIAISQIQAGCGGTAVAKAGPGEAFLQIDGDVSASGQLAGDHLAGEMLSLRASGEANVLDAVIAAGGAVPGAFGSFFRTSLQLTNIDLGAPIAGKIVFHPAGTPASPTDPSMSYSLTGGATASYPDVVAAMGASGLGSLDIVTTGSAAPLATVRVFDDQGATAGTKGFTEEALPPYAAIRSGERLTLAIPPDLTSNRVNVGIRTLDDGADIVTSTHDSGGAQQGNVPFEVARQAAPQLREDQFVDSVSRSLREGRILILLVGDGIREGVQSLAELVNRAATKAFSFGLIEVALYEFPGKRIAIQPRVVAETELLTRHVTIISTGEKLKIQEEEDDSTSSTVPPKNREHLRRFWEPLLRMRFDDPEQESPKWIPATNNLTLSTPFPGIRIKAYANVGGEQCGVFVTGTRGENVEAIRDFLRREKRPLASELPEGTEIDVSSTWPLVIKQTGAASTASRQQWLREMLNAFVNVLRPRLKKWYTESRG